MLRILAVLIAVLAGCGKGGSEKTPPAPIPATAVPPGSPDPAAAAAPEPAVASAPAAEEPAVVFHDDPEFRPDDPCPLRDYELREIGFEGQIRVGGIGGSNGGTRKGSSYSVTSAGSKIYLSILIQNFGSAEEARGTYSGMARSPDVVRENRYTSESFFRKGRPLQIGFARGSRIILIEATDTASRQTTPPELEQFARKAAEFISR